MVDFDRMMQLFGNWLDVISDHASDDAYVEGTPNTYKEFSEEAVSALEEIIMPSFYEYYMAEYKKNEQGDAEGSSEYPVVTLTYHEEDIASGRLDSAAFVQSIVAAMHGDNSFAEAMADFFDPEINNEIWEDTTYEEIAIGIVDFCKSQYREWKALQSRGREDNPFIIISDDESIVIS